MHSIKKISNFVLIKYFFIARFLVLDNMIFASYTFYEKHTKCPACDTYIDAQACVCNAMHLSKSKFYLIYVYAVA